MNRSTAILYARYSPNGPRTELKQGLEEMREMCKNTLITKAASIAVVVGILLSQTADAFDNLHSAIARDVELQPGDTLMGFVYTSEQNPVENAMIELRYKGTTIARTTTGSRGDFVITGVRGGAHDVTVGSISSPVRLWKNGTAPNGTVDSFVVSANEQIVRGQSYDPYYDHYYDTWPGGFGPPSGFGLSDLVAVAVIGAAATAVIIAIDDHKDRDKAPVIVSP